MMKKFLALMLALVMALSLVACGQKNQDSNGTYDTDKDTDVTDVAYKVAMITDYGDITDQSFNQTTYEACKAFAGPTVWTSSTSSPPAITPPTVWP